MTFGVEDYEKSIARIFDKEGKNVIGTGFLVAPGYVLTCAHVVLQAIGVQKEQFAEHQTLPQQSITLDFHVLAAKQFIQAEVVAWSAYTLETGDIAALKLRTAEPTGVRPIPMVEVQRAEIENQSHSVYGFGKSSAGGRSDAYRPKANSSGGRFQLCKVGDPNDETIKPGFSGAPVWNEERKCVVGMVATAVVAKDEQQSTAYAIPVQVLRPILKQIEAFYLHDVLMQSLDACGNDTERNQLKSTIDGILRRCNPQGVDRPWPEQLMDLSIDRAPLPGWEIEGRLVHLATMLAPDVPLQAYDQLQIWVERCHWNFQALSARLTREKIQQKKPANNVCEHLMVVVEQKERLTNQLRVSLWQVPDRSTYEPQNPLLPVIADAVMTISELPIFIRRQIKDKFRKATLPTIHLFVPRSLFGCDLEMLPSSNLGETLGSHYPFIIRTNLNTHPIGQYYYDDWYEKWKKLESLFDDETSRVFQAIDCSSPGADLVSQLVDINAAILQDCDSVSDLFDLISDETFLPVALWSRDPEFQAQLPGLLDCVVKTFRDRLRQERDTARRSTTGKLLGHHLSLVWEDPLIVPPDMYFDPEAC
jgi:vWA-MoxR associated protein C-terminal domain/Trypsin-like peptidase domain/vWA-MoxR associated protein middle region (VMAP-M) 1